jgi:hypothetical protein
MYSISAHRSLLIFRLSGGTQALVAVANKNARIAWALLTKKEDYCVIGA